MVGLGPRVSVVMRIDGVSSKIKRSRRVQRLIFCKGCGAIEAGTLNLCSLHSSPSNADEVQCPALIPFQCRLTAIAWQVAIEAVLLAAYVSEPQIHGPPSAFA